MYQQQKSSFLLLIFTFILAIKSTHNLGYHKRKINPSSLQEGLLDTYSLRLVVSGNILALKIIKFF